MPYATPQQVIAEYGLKEVAQLLADDFNDLVLDFLRRRHAIPPT